MLMLPDVSEAITASRDCVAVRPCSPNDVIDSDDSDHFPIVVEETNDKSPNVVMDSHDSDHGRSELSSPTNGDSSSNQGNDESPGQVSPTEFDIKRATGEKEGDKSIAHVDRVPTRGIPKSRSERILAKSSSFLKRFTNKKRTEPHAFNVHSCHSTPDLHPGLKNETSYSHNSYHSRELTELIQINSGNKRLSVASVHRMLHADDADVVMTPGAVRRLSGQWRLQDDNGTVQDDKEKHRSTHNKMSFSSTLSSFNEGDQDLGCNELDVGPDPLKTIMDSSVSHESLGDSPSLHEHVYVEECLSTQVSVLDRKRWDNIQEFSKLDLMLGKHLGRGSFSDVFEVIATVVKEDVIPSLEALSSDRADLNKLIEAKFSHQDGDAPEKIIRGNENFQDNDFLSYKEAEEIELDKEVDALFIRGEDSEQKNQDKGRPERIHYKSRQTRHSMDLGRSVCMGTVSRPTYHKSKVTLAMKCLRPQVRSSADQFIIGLEDLVHETTVLASLDHPNIIKIHGRACGRNSASFRLGDGFFILLDKLAETLEDRIRRWKKLSYDKRAPHLSQINTACSIADALSYLHAKRIVFCDLKPANVGFDSTGVLKLFDFGFASSLPDVGPCETASGTDSKESHLLYNKCGTPRYMAPEVALELGYSLPADVYSFGILLWEICSLKKPFGGVKSADELHMAVFVKNSRPKLCRHFPQVLRDLMTSCWSSSVDDRPEMWRVKTMLSAHAREIFMPQNNRKGYLRGSFTFRRTTWDK
ncbi:hypothetical protein ACHAXA_004255 [Cyclostephanos tholiformis]|uniref:Protein kinase domain-containing protein n=1 Tax=Cyclostephanos tholiformis TaxID=382380 RepID=A0ABD3RG35_9STRA